MKLKVFLAGLVLSLSTSVFAAKITFNDNVDAETKTAIESAIALNEKVKAAGFEWIWANPTGNLWEKTSSLMTSSKILDQAIEMANAGNKEAAIKAAKYIENAAKQGLKQAELAPTAGPADYGL